MRAPRVATAMSSSRTTRSKYGAKPFVVADHDDARAGRRALREKELQERSLGVAVERRRRLVGDDDLRRADQCAGGGDALLLADAQARGSYGVDHRAIEAEACSSRTATSSSEPSDSVRSRRVREKRSGSSTLSTREA